MDIQTIQPALKTYLDNLASQIHISEAFIFGSVAENKQTLSSDIDLLVLSDDFSTLDTDQRSKLLYRASVGFPYDLHVYGVTSGELAQASELTTLGQIRNSPNKKILY